MTKNRSEHHISAEQDILKQTGIYRINEHLLIYVWYKKSSGQSWRRKKHHHDELRDLKQKEVRKKEVPEKKIKPIKYALVCISATNWPLSVCSFIFIRNAYFGEWGVFKTVDICCYRFNKRNISTVRRQQQTNRISEGGETGQKNLHNTSNAHLKCELIKANTEWSGLIDSCTRQRDSETPNDNQNPPENSLNERPKDTHEI